MVKKDENLKDLEGAEIELLPVDEIRPNGFNCNVMDEVEYNALVKDMKKIGHPDGMAAVIVRQLHPNAIRKKGKTKIKYEIIDGEHRWKAAGELGWTQIKTLMFSHDKITQTQALILNFKINRQRGSHDPFKEARFFNYLADIEKMTQKDIAKLLNVNRTTVNKRISIVKIDRKILEKVPHGTDSPVSVLEIVAQGPTEEDQFELLKEYHQWNYTVSQLEGTLKRKKHEFEQQQKFIAERDKSAKFKNCPKCKKLAIGKSSDGRYNCENWHEWNPKTGELYDEDDDDWEDEWDDEDDEDHGDLSVSEFQATEDDSKKLIRCFRSPYHEEDVVKAIKKAFKKAMNTYIDHATGIDIHQDYGSYYGSTVYFNTRYGVNLAINSDQGRLVVKAQNKDYKFGDANMKVDVSTPTVTAKHGTSKGEELFEQLMKGLLTFNEVGEKKKKK